MKHWEDETTGHRIRGIPPNTYVLVYSLQGILMHTVVTESNSLVVWPNISCCFLINRCLSSSVLSAEEGQHPDSLEHDAKPSVLPTFLDIDGSSWLIILEISYWLSTVFGRAYERANNGQVACRDGGTLGQVTANGPSAHTFTHCPLFIFSFLPHEIIMDLPCSEMIGSSIPVYLGHVQMVLQEWPVMLQGPGYQHSISHNRCEGQKPFG